MSESESHVGLETEWADLDSLRIQPNAGDIIEFNRGPYNHAGVADGEGSIYHFGGDAGLDSKSGATWRHNSIADVAKGDRVRINNSLDNTENTESGIKYTPRDQDEIIKDCKDFLGSFGKTYNLLDHNCQHKATEIRYGVASSEEAKTAKKGTVVCGALVAWCSVICGFAIKEAADKGAEKVTDETTPLVKDAISSKVIDVAPSKVIS